MTDLTLAQQQETEALVAKQITQDKAQAYEMLGMVKMSDFTRKLVTVSRADGPLSEMTAVISDKFIACP